MHSRYILLLEALELPKLRKNILCALDSRIVLLEGSLPSQQSHQIQSNTKLIGCSTGWAKYVGPSSSIEPWLLKA